MESIKFDYAKIREKAPKAWKDVGLFYQPYFVETGLSIEKIPFEMLLGILLRYFHENGVDWDVSNMEFDLLPESLLEVFENYEKVISHYS